MSVPALLATVALLGIAPLAVSQDDPKPPQASRSQFMRKKLDFAKDILEGLAVEDYSQISKAARAMKILSQAAEWEVPTIPNVEQYLAYTTEFQRRCDDLNQKARQRSLDGATLAFEQLTLSCVNCHKYVRSAGGGGAR
jgi:cytochrome c556